MLVLRQCSDITTIKNQDLDAQLQDSELAIGTSIHECFSVENLKMKLLVLQLKLISTGVFGPSMKQQCVR